MFIDSFASMKGPNPRITKAIRHSVDMHYVLQTMPAVAEQGGKSGKSSGDLQHYSYSGDT